VIYTVSEAARRAARVACSGIAVGPDYLRDSRVYLYYTTGRTTRIAYVVQGIRRSPAPILDRIPAATTHDGGRIIFGRTACCTPARATRRTPTRPRTGPASAARSCG
jgi:glucose/arabinose dehydrogenase